MQVLVPFAVQPVSERAVTYALEAFGPRDDIHITALHVGDADDPPSKIAANEIESMGEEYDATVEAEIRTLEGDVESRAAIRDAIVDVVETEDVDLVVIGHEQKPLLERLLRSDTAERVLRDHDTPVTLVP